MELHCPTCDAKFGSYNGLRTHMISAHLSIRLRCKICKMCFVTREILENHERDHRRSRQRQQPQQQSELNLNTGVGEGEGGEQGQSSNNNVVTVTTAPTIPIEPSSNLREITNSKTYAVPPPDVKGTGNEKEPPPRTLRFLSNDKFKSGGLTALRKLRAERSLPKLEKVIPSSQFHLSAAPEIPTRQDDDARKSYQDANNNSKASVLRSTQSIPSPSPFKETVKAPNPAPEPEVNKSACPVTMTNGNSSYPQLCFLPPNDPRVLEVARLYPPQQQGPVGPGYPPPHPTNMFFCDNKGNVLMPVLPVQVIRQLSLADQRSKKTK